MNEIPGDLKFLKSHEWARIEDNGTVTVGISDHAQGLLGDLVYVELPSVGDDIKAGNACAVVESVKAASDVYSPVSGEIVAVNRWEKSGVLRHHFQTLLVILTSYLLETPRSSKVKSEP